MLERQTIFAVGHKPIVHEHVHELIITLRKALSQQKRLEELCESQKIPVEYRWSLNQVHYDEPTKTELQQL
jgi:phosphohistidine phosphatase SixA